jgi:hypothetical protein
MSNNNRKKGGRPVIQISLDDVRKLAAMGCTDAELAAFFECSVKTIERRRSVDDAFRDAFEMGRAIGHTSLRRLQWQAANNGNTQMLIWLGKQLLGQRDFRAMEISGRDGGPVEMNWSDLIRSIAEGRKANGELAAPDAAQLGDGTDSEGNLGSQ